MSWTKITQYPSSWPSRGKLITAAYRHASGHVSFICGKVVSVELPTSWNEDLDIWCFSSTAILTIESEGKYQKFPATDWHPIPPLE